MKTRTRRLYGVLIFFVFASSLLFAVGMPYPGLAFAEETAVARAYGGPGLLETPLYADQTLDVGMVSVWNSRENLQIQIKPSGEWLISAVHIYVGTGPVPTKNDNPIPGKFPYKKTYPNPVSNHTTVVNLKDDLNFSWGEPWEDQRVQIIAVHVDLVILNGQRNIVEEEGAWAFGPNEFEGSQWGWWLNYEMAHPKRGHFIDSPVGGLSCQTPTYSGVTDESGGFDYFPGERVELAIGSVYIGSPLADHKISPLDIFEFADTHDIRVINMARFLQSLDADGDPKAGISITEGVVDCLEQTVQGLTVPFDFSNDTTIQNVIDKTIACALPDYPDMIAVSAEDAKANLDKSLNSNMFRKNVSRTPDMGSAKAKLNIMGVWLPALSANGEPASFSDDSGEVVVTVTGIPYYNDPDPVDNGNGTFTYPEPQLIRVATEAKPIVAIYCDELPETGAHDVFASISRDDGNTWKRRNISRMADKSSFTLANGQEYYGHCKKPVFQVKGNKILVAWTTKFAKGGKPRYSITTCDDPTTPEIETVDPVTGLCRITCHGEGDNEVCEHDYPHDDPYYADDIWGVSGPQRSVDYEDQGYPEVGEVPYSAVWVARAVIATQADINNGLGADVGDIVWFKPERLTSARRDANQNFLAGADGAGFAVTWQEDPDGLRPGEAKGPGPGWGGATTNHKTDIWYSYITWGDFAKVDGNFEAGGDPEHADPDFIGRPKALVPMSLPVRVSDNDVVNTHNMWIELDDGIEDPCKLGYPLLDDDGNFIPIINPYPPSDDADGSHRYGYMVEGLWDWNRNMYRLNDPVDWEEGNGGTLYEFLNQQDEEKTVVVTADGRLLDGNTGAARSNLFMQTYTKADGSKSAWAIMAYEETKGVGLGPPEDSGEIGDPVEDGSGYDPYETFPDEGKNAIYHSFDFQNPDVVSAGTILNLPETDGELIGDGNLVYVTEVPCFGSDENGDCIENPAAGERILDWKGDPILNYENARRPRFILQSKAAATAETEYSGTVLIVLYKEGQDGGGRPTDIMARRCVAKGTTGNPYAPANFVDGAQNVSTVTPILTWTNPDRENVVGDAKGDGVKVCSWEQPVGNLDLKSGVNPYEDSRAHRGGIRGDFVIMGYSYTPNWAASRKAHDKYDFYIRRSFDGGATWTTDPDSTETVVHTDIFIDPEGVSGFELTLLGEDASEATKHYEVETTYGEEGCEYEPGRNVSLTKNNKTSVIEPRIVAVPGTIKDPATKSWTGIPEDEQNPDVFYVAYGTATNLPDVGKAPEDLFFSFSTDKGTTLFEEEWVVNPDSEGNYPGETVTGWYRLAKGDQEQGEVQLRMTPDGSRFYSVWLDEGEVGSDILFRRIMPKEFECNVAPETP